MSREVHNPEGRYRKKLIHIAADYERLTATRSALSPGRRSATSGVVGTPHDDLGPAVADRMRRKVNDLSPRGLS